MKIRLFKKFFLINSLIILLSIMVVSVLLSIFISNYLTGEKKETLKENCYAVATMVNELEVSDLNNEQNISIFRAFSGITEAEIFIADGSGKVLICSCEDWQLDGICSHNSGQVPKKVMGSILTEDYNTLGDFDGMLDGMNFIYGTAIQNNKNGFNGAVFAVLSPQNIKMFYNAIIRIFFLSAIVPIIVMLFAEYIISYRLIRPLKLMAEASRRMAKGDFSKRIPVTGDDEIGELAVAFNQMTNSLVQIEGTRRRFIANISHELKTPMTTISGFIDGIVDGTIPPEKHSYYLSIVSAEVKRLSRLVQSMLNLAKLESGEQKINKTEFDFCDMLFKILVSQEQRIEKQNIEVLGLEDCEAIIVNADYDLLYQVVYNLVDNAVKFTNQGGKISFKIFNDENGFNFKIRNTGLGIDEKELPFVFERFYKSDRSRSAAPDSTGLGLYLANTIISIHGGKITAQSKVNEFTEFAIILKKSMLLEGN